MELRINDGHYRDDHYFVITDFVFSALCILGTAEPCFESAVIGRQYSLTANSSGSHALEEFSQFKKEFQLMMEEYKKFNADSGSALINESTPKEDAELSKILFSNVCAKINELLAEHVFRHKTGKQV